jgi:hypothetical protein
MKTKEYSFKTYFTFRVIYKITNYSSLHGLGNEAYSDFTYSFHLFQGLLGLSTIWYILQHLFQYSNIAIVTHLKSVHDHCDIKYTVA